MSEVDCFSAEVHLNFERLANILTLQGQREGSISLHQTIKINSIELDDDDQMMTIDCDICEDLLN